jgi:antitoxin (DNA-binding transcriptional repressor) of toxin-antitoxin stability system
MTGNHDQVKIMNHADGEVGMTTVNIAQAKATLSALVNRVAAGEEIVLAKAGKPVARLTVLPAGPPRRPGVARHWILDDAALVAPLDAEELDWADGVHADPLGVTKPDR